jgi:hypothetical protein
MNNPAASGSGPESWIGGEADEEIARLRSALDEHLRRLDTPSPPRGTGRQNPPPRSDSGTSREILTSMSPSISSRTSEILRVAGLSGLVIVTTFFIALRGFELEQSSAVRSPSRRQVSDNSSTPLQPEQKRSSSSPAPNPFPLPSEQADTTEPRIDSVADDRPSPASTVVARWEACIVQDDRDADPPQSGETWWPVVGSSDSLSDARRYCRADAFINRSGNAQISSFRDRQTAMTFAEQLTRDSSHSWRFRVGEPSVR